MDIVVQRLSKIRELAEVIARINRVPKFFKTAMELPAENTAGCVADHGNVHGNHIPFKGGVAALLDSIPQTLPGLCTKALHADNFIPVLIQPV